MSASKRLSSIVVLPLLPLDEVLVEAHGAGEAVVLQVLVGGVQGGHLLGAVDHRGEADAVGEVALIEAGVGGAGHDVGDGGQAREGMGDGRLHGPEGLAVDVGGGRIVVGVDHGHLQIMLLRQLFEDGQGLLLTLMGDVADVGADGSGPGQDVVRLGAGGHGEGHGGLEHGGGGGADGGQGQLQDGPEEPQVPQHQLQGEGAIGRETAEHGGHLGQELLLEGVFVHVTHEGREPVDGGVLPWGAGVAAPAAGGEIHVGAALLKDAQHGEVAGDAADGLPDDGAALVHDQEQVHAPAADLLHQLGAAVAAHLLGAGGGQVHVAVGGVALREELLHGLQEGHDGALGVAGAPAPDLALRDGAGEGRVLPLAAGGDHVLMAHEQDGLLPAPALPVVEEVPVDVRDLQLLMDQGKELLEDLMKGFPLLGLVLALEGGGVALDHLGELLSEG